MTDEGPYNRRFSVAHDHKVVTVVSTIIGDFPIALDATFVKDIRKDNTLKEHSALPRLDLYHWLGRAAPDDVRRKILVVDLPGAPYLLVAGRQARIMSVAWGRLRRLPPFIEGLRQRSCLMGLILGEAGDLWCLLDEARLGREIAAREEP